MPQYEKNVWVDHIVDPASGDVIQEGTRFTAARMNKIEDGIAAAETTEGSQAKVNAITTEKINMLATSAKTPTALPSSYAKGYTEFRDFGTWSMAIASIASGLNIIETIRSDYSLHAAQRVTILDNATLKVLAMYQRGSYEADSWGAWERVIMATQLDALSASVSAQMADKADKKITDDTTAKKYTLGISNGLLYYKEVV